MEHETIATAATAARSKAGLLRNSPLQYLILSAMAGAYVGLGIVLLMAAVVTWLLGFDTLYSLQDEAFDRSAGLRSIPARFGAGRAMIISEASPLATVGALAGCGLVLHRGTGREDEPLVVAGSRHDAAMA